MEGIAVPLYFAVVVALVSIALGMKSEYSLTMVAILACRVLGDGGPWRRGGVHHIFEQRVAKRPHVLYERYTSASNHTHRSRLTGSPGGGD